MSPAKPDQISIKTEKKLNVENPGKKDNQRNDLSLSVLLSVTISQTDGKTRTLHPLPLLLLMIIIIDWKLKGDTLHQCDHHLQLSGDCMSILVEHIRAK